MKRSALAVIALLSCCTSGYFGSVESSRGAPLAMRCTRSMRPSKQEALLSVRGGVATGGKKSAKKPSNAVAASKKKVEEEEKQNRREEEEEDEDEWDEDDEDDDDEDDDDDDEDEDEDEDKEELSRPPPRSAGKPKRPNADWHYGSRKKRQAAAPSALTGLYGLAKGVVKIAGKSVTGVADVIQPNKFVGLREVVGVWNMKQKVMFGQEKVRCEATIEIRKNGTVITFFNGKEMISDFRFKERTWPRACAIEFEAKAFKAPGDRSPLSFQYKAYLKRNLMNSKVVRLEGKIYDGSSGWFRSSNRVGSFKATKVPRVK